MYFLYLFLRVNEKPLNGHKSLWVTFLLLGDFEVISNCERRLDPMWLKILCICLVFTGCKKKNYGRAGEYFVGHRSVITFFFVLKFPLEIGEPDCKEVPRYFTRSFGYKSIKFWKTMEILKQKYNAFLSSQAFLSVLAEFRAVAKAKYWRGWIEIQWWPKYFYGCHAD